MTGATEATLADLLATAQAMNVNLIKLQSIISRAGTGGGGSGGGGGSSGGSPASSAASLLSSFNPLSMAFGVLKGVVSGISSVFGFLSDVVSTVIGGLKGVAVNLYEFAKSTAMGTSKLSEFYGAFSGLPILGTFFGILSAFTAYQENLLAVYQKLTDSGASFGGSLSAMRASAARAYMSMDDFTKIVQTNSDLFATMGGNVQSGINKFVTIAAGLYGPGSKYGNMLAGLGYTSESAAEALALYMRGQGTMNKIGLENTEKVTKGAAEYAIQLNTLSQLTGESNADLRKKIQKIQMEEAYQIYLSTLSPDKADKVNAAIAERIALGGEEAGQSLKNSLLGVNVAQTDQQKAIEVMTGGMLSKSNQDITDAIKSGKSKDYIIELERRNAIEAGKRSMAVNKQLGASMGVVGIQQQMLATAQYTQTVRRIQDDAKLTDAEKKIKTEQAKQAAGSAAALEQNSKAIRSFGAELLEMVYGAIVPMVPFLKKFAQTVLDAGISLLMFVTKHMPQIVQGVQDVWTWFKNTLAEMKKAYGEKGWSGVFDVMGDKIGQLWDTVKGPLLKMFDSFVEFLKPYMLQVVDFLEDKLNAMFWNLPGGQKLFGAVDPKDREQDRKLRADTDSAKRAVDLLTREIALLTQNNIEKRNDQTILSKQLELGTAQNRLSEAKESEGHINGRQSTIRPRHSGTLGMTGSWWEKQDATLNVQAGESVVTPSQMAQITGQNGVAEGIQRLNSLTAQLLAVMKQNTDYTQRNYNATKELGGNLFATV